MKTSASSGTVFVVDDDASFLKSASRLLRAAGYAVQAFESAPAFLGQLTPETSGCVVTDLGILADQAESMRAHLSAAAGSHDLVVTSGGVSMGEEDHVRAAIAAGGSLVFWRMAIKPGRPVAMGVMEGTPLIGLPGNPVAVFVTFAHVLRPLIAALAGAIPTPLNPATVTAGFSHRKKAGRREYLRVSLQRRGTETVAIKYPVEGAGVITSLTRTDGLVELDEESTGVAPGDPIPFIDYRQMT